MRLNSFYRAALTLTLLTCADSPELTPGECIAGDCENGSGTMELLTGKYTGQFQDGERSGYGVMEFEHGGRYEGEWRLDRRHGPGTYEVGNGRYVGSFSNDSYDGHGTFTYTGGEFKGQQYRGEWKQDERIGLGVLTIPDGRTFIGEHIDDGLNGSGYTERIVESTGNPFEYKYFGEFKNGEFHGKGVLIWPEGDTFIGEFEAGERKHGVHSYQRSVGMVGEKYIGPIVDGKFHGEGTYLFADGRRYVGEFVNGKFEGRGALYYRGDDPDYTHYEGLFANDVFASAGVLYYKSGEKFEGLFQDGEQWSGVLLGSDGNVLKTVREGEIVTE